MSYRDSSCTGKIRYPSKHKAKQAKKEIRRRFDGRPNGLVAYSCVFCCGFHLGNNDKAVPLMDLDEALAVMI